MDKGDGWRRRLRIALMVVAPVVAGVAGGYVYLTGGRYVSTDDAYVQAARVSISSDVPGRVVEIAVHDNQPVKAGQVLFKLDDRPYRIAIQDAEAQLALARLKVDAGKETYRQRRADVMAAEETLDFQTREFNRQKRLLASGIASQSQYDQAVYALKTARQRLDANRHQVSAVLAELAGNADIAPDRHPQVQQAQAALDRARLNLAYSVVVAPEDGMLTKVEQLQVGDYVTTAEPLFSLVATSRLWIEANFKETDLTDMHPGQAATVDVDTYPDRQFAAHVVSLSPGTGSTFSLLPPENATGNWVKVVQRLPVRLQLDDLPAETSLQAGMSVTVEVDTHGRRHLLATLRSAFGMPEAAGAGR
jgi:membrane fusion protein (multidrug efflux system)